jgi:DNA-directed RNA polymerase specialized sigma54-like protein
LEPISISEAARKIGINKSTLSRQVEGKAVRSHGGKVVLSEVLADRAANIDLTQSRRRSAKVKASAGGCNGRAGQCNARQSGCNECRR